MDSSANIWNSNWCGWSRRSTRNTRPNQVGSMDYILYFFGRLVLFCSNRRQKEYLQKQNALGMEIIFSSVLTFSFDWHSSNCGVLDCYHKSKSILAKLKLEKKSKFSNGSHCSFIGTWWRLLYELLAICKTSLLIACVVYIRLHHNFNGLQYQRLLPLSKHVMEQFSRDSSSYSCCGTFSYWVLFTRIYHKKETQVYWRWSKYKYRKYPLIIMN